MHEEDISFDDAIVDDAIVGAAEDAPPVYVVDMGATPTKSSAASRVFGAILAIVIVLIILILVYYLYVNSQGIGAALTRAGWSMWSQDGCSACLAQAAIIGPNSFKYVKKQKCRPGRACPVSAFPTWTNSRTGAKRVGVQGPMDLKSMTKV